MRLRDWEIEAELSTMAEVGDNLGDCGAEPRNRSALIRIAVDMPPADLERIVIHEMLHCHTATLPAKSAEAQKMAEEQLISTVADALARLRYATPTKPKKGTL